MRVGDETGATGPRLAREELSTGPPRTPLTLQRFPEAELTARNQPPWVGSSKTNQQKPTPTPLPFPPDGASQRSKMEKQPRAFRTNALLVRKRGGRPAPRAPAKRRGARVGSPSLRGCTALLFRAEAWRWQSGSGLAPPSRGNMPEGLISGTGMRTSGGASSHLP